MNEIREFGTGLRDHLEIHGVRLDARAEPPSNEDLFALAEPEEQQAGQGLLTLQPA
jgi:hypothetical protein